MSALGRDEEARASYETVYPLLEKEPRCARVDWERHSLYVNVGNTYSREGDFEKADERYIIAERLGQDHIAEPGGSERDGMGMVIVAKRAKAFALKKAGKEAEAKDLLKEVITMQIEKNKLEEEKKKEEEAEAAAEDSTSEPTQAAIAAENPAS